MSSAAALMFALACGSAKQAESASPDGTESSGQPLDVQALMAREADGLTERAALGPGVKAQVLSSAQPKFGTNEGMPELTIPIGSQASIHCMIFPADPDPGGAFSVMVDNLKRQFEVRELKPGNVDIVNDSPVSTLSVIYAAPTEQGKALGQLKLALHSRFGSSSLCRHDEIGYQKTFAQVSRSFFASLDKGTRTVQPEYVEILVARVNGIPAGYERNLLLKEKDGARKLVSTGVVMLLASDNELVTQDHSSVVALDDKDRIATGHWVESANNTLLLDVQLERVKGNRYRYRGSRRGQELQGELSSKDPLGLPSSVWAQNELKGRLGSGKPFKLVIEQYRPSDNPTEFTLSDFVRSAGDPPRTVKNRVDETEATLTIDEQGREQRTEIAHDSLKVVLERAFQRAK